MKVLIWGTGKLASNYMRYEYFASHQIVGFVDTYKTTDLFMGYSVYSPNEVNKLDFEYLLICVMKGNDEILQTCKENNINLGKIILVNWKETNEEEEKVSRENLKTYFPLIYKDIQEKKRHYNYINSQDILNNELVDTTLISSPNDGHVTVWIPIELLFMENRENIYNIENDTDKWEQQNRKYENIPIVSFEPYRNLFSFLMEGREYPSCYCQWFQNLFLSRGMSSGYTNELLIEKRTREFKIMQHELNVGMNFFINHPIKAKWNKKGYFNILDGHHRCAFLYYSGIGKMPAEITCKDYEFWKNKEKTKAVHEILLKQHRTEFYQPILNPYFLNIHPYRDDYVKSRLHHILRYFGNTRFAGKKVIDIGANLGYIGQAFCRMGAEVTLLEPDPIHYDLIKVINELLYTDCEVITQSFEEYESNENYDIAVLLTVFYPYFSNEKIRDEFMLHLNKNINEMIIWESGDFPDREKEYILKHTKFCNYTKLCYTYATGKFREMGVFMTEDSEYLSLG